MGSSRKHPSPPRRRPHALPRIVSALSLPLPFPCLCPFPASALSLPLPFPCLCPFPASASASVLNLNLNLIFPPVTRKIFRLTIFFRFQRVPLLFYTTGMMGLLEHFKVMGVHQRLFDSFLALLFFFFLRLILIKLAHHFQPDKGKDFFRRKAATYISVFVLILLLALTWINAFSSLSTYLGLLSAGLAVALKDPLTNLAGWLFILVRKPFETGDRIQIGDYAGDVVDIDIFQFSLMESGTAGTSKDMRTGRLVRISNGTVFTQPQVNFTKGWFEFTNNIIEVTITFESNWKKAKAILEEIALAEVGDASAKARDTMNRSTEKYMILDMSLDPFVLTEVGTNGVVLTTVYLCHPRLRRLSANRVWAQVLERFSAEHDIAFAYSTQRSFNAIAEGKTTAGTVQETPPSP